MRATTAIFPAIFLVTALGASALPFSAPLTGSPVINVQQQEKKAEKKKRDDAQQPAKPAY